MTSIIISHKLNEISYVADKITVIRDGSTIETLDKEKDDISEARIIKGMVGRELTDRSRNVRIRNSERSTWRQRTGRFTIRFTRNVRLLTMSASTSVKVRLLVSQV